MLAWTAAILAALALAWFIGAVVVPVWQTRKVVTTYAHDRNYQAASVYIARLGGNRQAARRLRGYLHLPRWVAGERLDAVSLLGCCGEEAAPGLVEMLRDQEMLVRWWATIALVNVGDEQARQAIPLLEKMTKEDDSGVVRLEAAEALKKIRGEEKK
jgi:hypothetical protein